MIPPPPLPANETAVENVRSGQKLLIYSIALNIAALPLRVTATDQISLIISGLISLAAIILSVLGILRLASGLGFSILLRVVFCILMIVPLISLITLVILNSKATAFLRKAGLHVGFLGANKIQT